MMVLRNAADGEDALLWLLLVLTFCVLFATGGLHRDGHGKYRGNCGENAVIGTNILATAGLHGNNENKTHPVIYCSPSVYWSVEIPNKQKSVLLFSRTLQLHCNIRLL